MTARLPSTPLHITPTTLRTSPGAGTGTQSRAETKAESTGHVADSVVMTLCGDLSYDTAGHLLEAAIEQITARPCIRHLHLDCAGLGLVDSMGLSVLLMLHRRTSAAGVVLHLNARTPVLDRLLTITGTLEHLTGRIPAEDPAISECPDRILDPMSLESSPRAARPTGPDTSA